MPEVCVRPAARGDLVRLTEIYNHYVVNTPITFDIETYTVERRESWFNQFSERGRHRLMVAEENGLVLGYAGTTRFRPKAAYDTTVELTIYCAQEAIGKRVGSRVYSARFEALKNDHNKPYVAGYTRTNAASAALHERFGFQPVGIYTEVGRKFGRYWDVAWMERTAKT